MWSPIKGYGRLDGQPVHLFECLSPSSKEEFEIITKRTLQKLISADTEEDWREIGVGLQSTDTYLFEKPDDGSGVACLRAETIINRTPKKIYDFVWTASTETKQLWDKDLLTIELLENVTEDIQVVYRSYKAPASIIAARDFVAISARGEQEGVYYHFGLSINHRDDNRGNSKYVRGNVLLTGLIFKPVPSKHDELHRRLTYKSDEVGKCRCIRIVQVDPKGMIPAWVVNTGKKKAGFYQLDFKKNIESLVSPSNTTVLPHLVNNSLPITPDNLHSNSSSPSTLEHSTNEKTNNQEDIFSSSDANSNSVETILQSLKHSLDDIQKSVHQSNQRLDKLEDILELQQIKQQTEDLSSLQTVESDGLFGLSWNFVGFSLVWPFVSYTILDLMMKK